MTKLRPHEVQEIRMWLRVGYSLVAVAGAYGVSKSAVNGIACGRTWAHLPERPAGGAGAELPGRAS